MNLSDLFWLPPLLLLGIAVLKRITQTAPASSSDLLDLSAANPVNPSLQARTGETIAPASSSNSAPDRTGLPLAVDGPSSDGPSLLQVAEAFPIPLSNLDSLTMASPPEAQPVANPFELPLEPAIVPLELPTPGAALNLTTFRQALITNLQNRGQTSQTATQQDYYSALLAMLNAGLLQQADLLQQTGCPTAAVPPRTVVEVAPEFALVLPLETQLSQLRLADSVQQGLQGLGLDLAALYQQDLILADAGTGRLSSGYLESLATQQRPALGQGLYWPTVDAATQSKLDDWLTPVLEEAVEVQLGGYTTDGADSQGRYQRYWQAATRLTALPYDLPVVGYAGFPGANSSGANCPTVNRLRLWQVNSNAVSASGDQSPALQQLEDQLQQHYVLASCAIQDLIRQQLRAERPLAELAEQFALRLNDRATVWVIPELMHQLVDRHGLGWDLAWSITQALVSWTYRDLPQAASANQQGRYPVALVQRLLPRHLEIIYEINRRWLDRVAESPAPTDPTADPTTDPTAPPTERLIRASLIDETGERWLRLVHLAAVGAARVRGGTSLHTQLIQTSLPLEFSRLYPHKFVAHTDGLSPRRFLGQTQPDLVALIGQRLGEPWLNQPDQWQQLQDLVQDVQFCGQWWEHKRAAKQALAVQLQQIDQTDLAISPSSLFEVQADSSAAARVLQLLHLITLYARIKTNASSDTILRFAHRSLPRTCILIGAVDHPLADSIAALSRAVATTINGDAATPQLQVSVLTDSSFRQLRSIYPATDLALHIAPADRTDLDTSALAFAMNGAVLAATPTYTNLELRQAIGAKHLFLFGPMAADLAQRRPSPQQLYSTNPDLKQAIDLIASGYFSQGDGGRFRPLLDWLLQDPEQVLTHYGDYVPCQERISQVYQDQKTWTWMSMLTLARLSHFSADVAACDAAPTNPLPHKLIRHPCSTEVN